MRIREPIFVFADDGLDVFKTAGAAERRIESVDVEDGVYRYVFDRDGQELQIVVEGTTTRTRTPILGWESIELVPVRLIPTNQDRADELVALLRPALMRVGVAVDGLDLDALADEAVRYFLVR